MQIRTALVIVAVGASYAAASDVWDEAINGDLSSDPAFPTLVKFALGSNIIKGSVTATEDVRDYITFTIPKGQALAALLLHQWEDLVLGGDGNIGFHAINEGDSSFIPDETTADLFLGGDHVIALPPGTDILPGLAEAKLAGTGFDIPLGPGTYSYLIQQTSIAPTGYTLDFVIVPAPASGLALAAIPLFALRRRR